MNEKHKNEKLGSSVPKDSYLEANLSQRTNPYHLPDDDDSTSEDEEEDDRPDPVDMPVPPYHTNIVINCPFDNCDLVAPIVDTTALIKHIKDEHNIVFKNLHHMYMALDSYLARWATELRQQPLATFASKCPNEDNVYIIDPAHCELDKKIREEMQKNKLDEILEIQQRERETDSKLPRKCLFCKIVCDNRTVLFKHMFSEHNFNIGLPDNLVNVSEFLGILESHLSKLQCLYCEKTFTSPAVLRKHMRKKKHFKIAPKNRQYDRFYVINYREPGKNWENLEHDNYESDDEREDDRSWADWKEEESQSTMCLFDNQMFPSPEEALNHMRESHSFDLDKIRKEKDLDFYKIIVLINYIRHQSSLNQCFSCGTTVDDFSLLAPHLEKEGCVGKFVPMDAEFWKDPKYLLPTYENDPLLTGVDDEESDVDEDLRLSDRDANRKFSSQILKEVAANEVEKLERK
ncbi:uncharacterized protein BYT42DRAFT_487161 [Radiomyces spectabilis]|uniref:uncharacterized protein n=1 Tax=Radiomyces spectabilis TaxID=64574 RepID=UPI002220253E|nr:uncharacterized protein BYT42DRAFT_487161 [Radiomyces spectabilis]KAI8394224.1 hypothetical protein BYT42DRAFT_487161 [Radiomyces spectabilis]